MSKTAIFEEVTLGFGGEKYVITADRVMGAIAVVEEHLTLKEIFEAAAHRKIRFSVLAQAYGALLRYAGADVGDDEVYVKLFQKDTSTRMMIDACEGLMGMMVPPNLKKKIDDAKAGIVPEGDDRPPGEPQPNRRARRVAAKRSRKRTRSRASPASSEDGASPPASSGASIP